MHAGWTHPVLQQIRIIHVHGPIVPEGELGQVEADAAANHLHTSHGDSWDALHGFLPQAHSAGGHNDLVESSMLLETFCCCLLSMWLSAGRLSIGCPIQRQELLIDIRAARPLAADVLVRLQHLGGRQ